MATLQAMSVSSHPLVQSELPSSVVAEVGAGGLPRLRVADRCGEAEAYLHGAHVTSWTPVGQAPVLWLSEASHFAPDKPIRGGVPICFPWFAAHVSDPGAPSHGFARLQDWTLVDAGETPEGVKLTFRLTDSEVTQASAWPGRFQAIYRVTVGPALVLDLEVTNVGDGVASFEEAFHTYLAVQDIRSVSVTGLEHTRYLNRLGGPQPEREGVEPVRFTGETDRIYLDTRATTVIRDVGHRRAIAISKEGSDTTVVWNPWTDKARAMVDFGDDEWPGMCCVETCNVRDARIGLDPGARHTMTATITVTAMS
jgi:glucose-6-phosphate 1-epimerase